MQRLRIFVLFGRWQEAELCDREGELRKYVPENLGDPASDHRVGAPGSRSVYCGRHLARQSVPQGRLETDASAGEKQSLVLLVKPGLPSAFG